MDNQTIYNAAHIISSVGKQLNSMFEHIEELVQEYAVQFKSTKCNATDKYDSSRWIVIAETYNFGIIEKRNVTKETIQIGFQVVIYDEYEENTVANWQPTLRVLIETGGSEAWDNESFTLHTALKDGYNLVAANKLFAWEDGGCREGIFLVPLAAIANREFLEASIIGPAFKLAGQLAEGAPIDTLTTPEEACGFSYDGDTISFNL